MLSVHHDITIGSTQFKSGSNSRLIALESDATIGVPINNCRMTFTVPADLSFTEGDDVTVKVGYKDELSTIFTGIVRSIEWDIGSVTIEAHSVFQQIAALRTHAYFENAFVGDIVKSLASETDVGIGTVQSGARFAFFAVGSNQSVWQYIQDLATKCGVDFFANKDDKLVFGLPLSFELPTILQFGINLLSCHIETSVSNLKGIEVYGESPASLGQGPESSSWFTKKEVKGSAGDNNNVRRIYEPAARAQETAALFATGLWQGFKVKKKGILTLLGKADLEIGQLVMVSSMPSDSQNGMYKIVAVRHQIKKDKGFITILNVLGE